MVQIFSQRQHAGQPLPWNLNSDVCSLRLVQELFGFPGRPAAARQAHGSAHTDIQHPASLRQNLSHFMHLKRNFLIFTSSVVSPYGETTEEVKEKENQKVID